MGESLRFCDSIAKCAFPCAWCAHVLTTAWWRVVWACPGLSWWMGRAWQQGHMVGLHKSQPPQHNRDNREWDRDSWDEDAYADYEYDDYNTCYMMFGFFGGR
eukprot:TRINITY_DN12667_c0_g1_i3.p2 TRINITY_DN12667_c0_g1~~TRINITY_DN12667_c0_g1_i3.p2  ORF type:complete len:102 (-),score=4.59 TRINITY_DN12667_c0_g1_i3:59-364(-)